MASFFWRRRCVLLGNMSEDKCNELRRGSLGSNATEMDHLKSLKRVPLRLLEGTYSGSSSVLRPAVSARYRMLKCMPFICN